MFLSSVPTIRLLLLCFPWVSFAQYVITGKVTDQETKEPLIASSILIAESNRGAVTDEYGLFSLDVKEGDVLIISYVGYDALEYKVGTNTGETLLFELISDNTLNELILTESRYEYESLSTLHFTGKDIESLPVLLGEVDVIKSIQLMPGVQGGGDAAGLYVRGGGTDQNLTLVDGVPIYNFNHIFGFFSVFQADIIDNVSLIKGGFPARFGGRLSSVIDMNLKNGRNDEFGGTATIGLLTSNVLLEGPFNKGKSTFLFSGRRTYIDLLSKPFRNSDPDQPQQDFFFQDGSLKLTHRFSDSDDISLFFYGSNDNLQSNYTEQPSRDITEFYDAHLRWGNELAGFTWNRYFNRNFNTKVTLGSSAYRLRLDQEIQIENEDTGQREESQWRYDAGVRDLSVRTDFQWQVQEDYTIRWGSSLTQHIFNPGEFTLRSDDFGDAFTGASPVNTKELSLFFENEIKLLDRLNGNLGVHYASLLTAENRYASIQPRVAVNYKVNVNTNIQLTYAEMAQFMHLLTNGGGELPTNFWIPVTQQIRPQTATQWSLGTSGTLWGFDLNLEFYYKDIEGIAGFRDGAPYLNTNDDWADKIIQGAGYSYGSELLIQRKVGELTGWLGYTWSKTRRKFNELNGGKFFPFRFDRTHDISLVLQHPIDKHVSASATWVYGTGNAITLAQTRYLRFSPTSADWAETDFINDGLEDFSERNSFRMRAYHRLDLGMSIKREKKGRIRVWSFGFYNFYNRKNPFFITAQTDPGGDRSWEKQSLFPLLPYVNYKFHF